MKTVIVITFKDPEGRELQRVARSGGECFQIMQGLIEAGKAQPKYTTQETDIYSLIKKTLSQKEGNIELIAAKPYSNHPDDWFCWVALVDRGEKFPDRYVTWEYNVEGQYFHTGHYITDYTAALRDFNQRFYDAYRKVGVR